MKLIIKAAVIGAGVIALAACNNTPAENAADNVEAAVDNATDNVEAMGDNAVANIEAAGDNAVANIEAAGDNAADANAATNAQ